MNIYEHLTHMYKSSLFVLKIGPLHLCPYLQFKTTNNELTPSKINTHNSIQVFYQRREVDGTKPNMDNPTCMSTGHMAPSQSIHTTYVIHQFISIIR